MAVGFAVTGFFFIAWPDGTLARLTEFGEHFGDFTPAPETDERLWLSLGFAYMVVITFLAADRLDRRGPLPADAPRPRGRQGGLVDHLVRSSTPRTTSSPIC